MIMDEDKGKGQDGGVWRAKVWKQKELWKEMWEDLWKEAEKGKKMEGWRVRDQGSLTSDDPRKALHIQFMYQ